MGAYAPAPLLNASLRHQCMGIVQATVTAMAEEGCPYQGVLYAGTYDIKLPFPFTTRYRIKLTYQC